MALYTLGPLLGKSPRLLRNRTPTNLCLYWRSCHRPSSRRFHSPEFRHKMGVHCHREYAFPLPSQFTHTLNSYYILSAKVLCAVAAVVGIPFLRETYGPVVLRRKALRVLSSGDAEAAITAEKILASDPLRGTGSKLNKIWVNISRPAVLLTRSFICFILSLYMA